MWQPFPEDISTTGFWVDKIFYLALTLTTIAFILVVAILLYFLIRYRDKPGHQPYYTRGDSAKAVLFTVGLALLVFIAIDVNLAFHDHHAWKNVWASHRAKDALRIEIMPEQFAWNFRYAGPDGEFATEDDIVTMNDMRIPVNKSVVVSMKSKDVIHSFFLPNFRVKQDVVPGLITMMGFEAKKTGTFDIACAEHCGLGHYRMRGILTVTSEENFNKWLEARGKRKSPADWGWKWDV